ncbi:MAG: hypothetical protein QG599_1570 [Pseudomonadota bacterium]|nr:hypothetical protein [Pseudomonadota bacterium]
MPRPSLRYWLTSLLLGPACALALEVGEIQVQSALNQLFDATIPLPTLTPEALNQVSVKIASPTMFEEFGLDQTPTLANLIFSIQYDAEGRVYVKVVSTQPIREPSLGLLLEFGWPRGKTFREFTVLLDPVRRLVERPSSRTRTVLNTTPDKPATEPATAPMAAPSFLEPLSLPMETPAPTTTYKPGDVYGPVATGEGLWGIALKVRPEGITREQMMQALFKINPQAFSSAGIEGLKIGAVLRIPTYREIADASGSELARQRAIAEKRPTAPTVDSAPVKPGTLEVFPLAQEPVPEPVVIPEPPKVAEPVAPPPVPTPEPAPEPPKVAEPVAPPPVPTPALKTTESEVLLQEPVSVTPLLFLAVSEILADAAKIPMIVPSEDNREPPIAAEKQTEPPLSITEPAPPITTEPLVEEPSPVTEPASPVTAEPPVPAPAEQPTVVEEPLATELPATADTPPARVYKGGEEYGPVANNERLWDIATKARPNPNMGLDVMMKALFMANPQAFSKPTMDHLKVGAMLRIPTLQEIVEYTGSPFARSLLEQPGTVESQKAVPKTGADD